MERLRDKAKELRDRLLLPSDSEATIGGGHDACGFTQEEMDAAPPVEFTDDALEDVE